MRGKGLLVLGLILLVIGLVGVLALGIISDYYAARTDSRFPGAFDPRGMMGPGGMMNWMMRDFSKSRYSSNGERIYLTGLSSRGRISAPGIGHMRVGCANCHGLDGRGGLLVPDGTESADIRWSSLQAEGMDEEMVKRAITQGVDEEGGSLSPYMPRWSMDPEDLDDLIEYLKTL